METLRPLALKAFTKGRPLVQNAILSNLLTTSLSIAIFAYTRLLEPLYGSLPNTLYLRTVVLMASTLAITAPRIKMWTALLASGFWLCACPLVAYWVGVLSARKLADPVWAPLLVHCVVLVPLVYLVECTRILKDAPLRRYNVAASPFPAAMAFAGSFGLVKNAGWVPRLLRVDYFQDIHILQGLGAAAIVVWALCEPIRNPAPFETAEEPKGDAEIKTEPEVKDSGKGKGNGKEKGKKSKETTTESKPKDTEDVPPPMSKYTQASRILPILPMLLPLLRPPILPHPLGPEPFTHPFHPVRILSSVQSNTGLIVVGEALPVQGSGVSEVRYLRAGHSILGGVWVGSKVIGLDDGEGEGEVVSVVDEEGTPLGDSIYSAFVLQEATRFAVPKPENALIIGLGTGIAASSFIKQNISTTVVEIDPAVYEAARKYFGMPDPGTGKVFLEDAKGWVTKYHRSLELGGIHGEEEGKFDIVVHDCFSGGGVPSALFTREFWKDLKEVVRPDGVVAVNFAGKLGSETSRAVLVTLLDTFRECRAFHDSFEELSEETMREEFLNMVFFCTPSAKPLTFRPATTSDYLNSPLRQHVLSSLPSREVDLSYIIGDDSSSAFGTDGTSECVVTEKNKKVLLEKGQENSTLEHWKVMRRVLPDMFWEIY
ncbi:hypothetical protein JAAARDRAFT_28016 [Jaapia argillacea MUCL 33604]|uniref:PABS domain-containing protein n=1 Tax=Jaapia argillacea MUCL 33604 TaxID=933084 RepID=A0A067QBP0_9AGAM|nr:hypothetical protein JAAARDRAFT_28016 [Jaapia argillacea MUCL 33604]